MRRLALAAVAALALAAAGCGGVEREPNLAQAAERTGDEPSFAFHLREQGSRFGKRLALACSGAVDSGGRRSRTTCEGLPEGYESITVGHASYVRFGDEKWTKTELYRSKESFFSPTRILELLRSGSRETRRVGLEEVRGEPAVHYALTVDCREAELGCQGESEVDVWIGDDGLVRRVGVVDGEASTTIEFFDFGRPLVVEPPPTDQVEEAPPEPGLCQIDDADPVGVEQAIDAFRKNGFDVRRSPGNCGPGIASEFGTPIPAQGEVELWCQVFTNGRGLSTSGTVAGTVTRSLENLVCRLISDHDAPDEAVDSLDAALAELKRELRG